MTECCSLPRRGSKPIKQNKRRNHVEWFRLFCTFYRVTPGGDCLYSVLVARHTALLYHAHTGRTSEKSPGLLEIL